MTIMRAARWASERPGNLATCAATKPTTPLRQRLADRRMKAVIPSLSNRKHPFRYEKKTLSDVAWTMALESGLSI